jgi:hypothetical protein
MVSLSGHDVEVLGNPTRLGRACVTSLHGLADGRDLHGASGRRGRRGSYMPSVFTVILAGACRNSEKCP